jgi:hypothetical protein
MVVEEFKRLSWGAYAFSWLIMAMTVLPLWVWQDGKYGILKAVFFAVFFAWVYGLKRNLLDVAVFALIMTGLQIFSRQVVNYHQLVFDARAYELIVLSAHAALTLFAAWLMSWLFDLKTTPGPSYTHLAAFFMMFYFGEFILHATGVMIWNGIVFSPGHAPQYLALEAMPYALWWSGAKAFGALRHKAPLLKTDAPWKRRFRDFENTRAVVFTCLALYAVSVVWFGFVHFAIGKLGVETHYAIAQECQQSPDLGAFMQHALSASIGLDYSCLAAASLAARLIDYLEVTVSLFLFLVLVQALALAFGASAPAQPPKRPE